MPKPRPDDLLDRAQVAELAGYVTPGTVTTNLYRSRVRRDQGKKTNLFPEPDRQVGRTPFWYRETIEGWLAHERLRRGEQPRDAAPKRQAAKRPTKAAS